ncbi:GNAT family N-acetyltransferase [Desulfosporosinus sp. OT]|uniref:GNAT family N-acetyltransferase n=1 Tax=Desulfosporosinus sp. OT TaxID=913865 RepID=UPI001FA6F39A|nr:GNAT family N-acetyltransferase [Desulfosporosinus sp. OT]
MYIRNMEIADYDLVIDLWKSTEGIGLSEADSKENIRFFLERNHGFSLVALKGNKLVGAVLAGHDGRRGYLHHLAVRREHRKEGLGRRLADGCLEKLKLAGIDKCHIFVFRENSVGKEFWSKIGWLIRGDLHIMSKHI